MHARLGARPTDVAHVAETRSLFEDSSGEELRSAVTAPLLREGGLIEDLSAFVINPSCGVVAEALKMAEHAQDLVFDMPELRVY